MDRPTAVPLRIGAWRLDPASGEMSRPGENVRVEARALRLLLCLAQRAGEVVSVDDLLSEVWSGVIVTPDSVYQAIAALRRVLGDDPKRPTYIATVPRLGYRMIAPVSLWAVEPAAPGPSAASTATAEAARPGPSIVRGHTVTVLGTRPALLGGLVALCVAIVAVVLYRASTTHTRREAAQAPPKSVAVLPFLDLTTQDMNEEYFADGMTEELIDRLTKIPGLRVPGPTSSFYFKGKHLKVADIASSLAVSYVLDGSIRTSGNTLRVAARLIRAADGYIVWSETYDRPLEDKLKIQDEIADEVARSLPASIH